MSVTISGLTGACVTGDEIDLFVGASGTTPLAMVVKGEGETEVGKAAWDTDTSAVIFFIKADAEVPKDTRFEFHFSVKNPASSQSSPVVLVGANGIPLPPSAMERNPSGGVPAGVVGGRAEEGRPLEVRGLLTQVPTLNPQPSTLDPEPWTQNPEPSTLDPEPWTPNPEP